MRFLAEVLFWVGRVENVLSVTLLVFTLAMWHWRGDAPRRWLTMGWVALFTISSILLWPEFLSKVTDGTGYVEAHLYSGFWRTDEEALSNVLMRWRNLWLPIYVPWVGVWAVGFLSIAKWPALWRLLRERH